MAGESVWDRVERLRREWTDKFVVPRAGVAELERFAGRTGRVVTVNFSGKAIVDFADGIWYDLELEALEVLDAGDPRCAIYDPNRNSAQARPGRQG